MAPEQWTIGSILRVTQDFFAGKGIDSARLDAELLLTSVLDLTRVQLYTQHDRPLSSAERDSYRELVRRRGAFEPVAYILEEKEFYGRPFAVDRRVLIPRPETEHLVDAVLEWSRGREVSTVLDAGTGSGCIALTLACELPTIRAVGTDLSAPALEVARANAALLGVADRTEWHQTDLFPPEGRFSVVASNPPYVPEGDPRVAEDVRRYEPADALYSGADGLDVIRRLLHDAPERLESPGLLAFELGAGQAEAVRELAPSVQFVNDLQGISRIALLHF